MHNLPQFANVLLGYAPCCLDTALFDFTRSTLDCGYHLPSGGLGDTVGWVGVPKFFLQAFVRREVCSFKDWRSVEQVLPVGYAVAVNPWRAHRSLSKGGGSMLMLVRGLAP